MNKDESLDLSQVSVANLLNNNAPSDIPAPEEPVAEEVAEEQVEEVAATEESEPEVIEAQDSQTVEAEVEEPVAEAVDEAAETSEPGVIDTLRQKLGYEIEGSFEDDYDGVVSFTQSVAGEIAKEQLDTVFRYRCINHNKSHGYLPSRNRCFYKNDWR